MGLVAVIRNAFQWLISSYTTPFVWIGFILRIKCLNDFCQGPIFAAIMADNNENEYNNYHYDDNQLGQFIRAGYNMVFGFFLNEIQRVELINFFSFQFRYRYYCQVEELF